MKTPQEHLDSAANNLGYNDFQHMLNAEENSVIEPIVLSRMDDHAKQLAQEVIDNIQTIISNPPNWSRYNSGLEDAINLIKQTFDLK